MSEPATAEERLTRLEAQVELLTKQFESMVELITGVGDRLEASSAEVRALVDDIRGRSGN